MFETSPPPEPSGSIVPRGRGDAAQLNDLSCDGVVLGRNSMVRIIYLYISLFQFLVYYAELAEIIKQFLFFGDIKAQRKLYSSMILCQDLQNKWLSSLLIRKGT